MTNLLKQFKADLAQVVLDFFWSTWSEAGVMGHGQSDSARIFDPEMLLLLTWEFARQDARVFDEVLDWLVRNGRWVNVVRLTALLKEDEICPPSLAGAVAGFMMQHEKGPKWRTLAQRCLPMTEQPMKPLFYRKGAPLVSLDDKREKIFASYGWARSPVLLRSQSQPVPTWRPTCLMLKCRALFGVNIRADVFAWLVANERGTAGDLARELGYSKRRVNDTLLEMQLAEIFQCRSEGNRKSYSLDAKKGWQLMFENIKEPAQWFNWRAFGQGVSLVWKKIQSMKEDGLTEYIFDSEIGKALFEARSAFALADLSLSSRTTPKEFLEKLRLLRQMQHS